MTRKNRSKKSVIAQTQRMARGFMFWCGGRHEHSWHDHDERVDCTHMSVEAAQSCPNYNEGRFTAALALFNQLADLRKEARHEDEQAIAAQKARAAAEAAARQAALEAAHEPAQQAEIVFDDPADPGAVLVENCTSLIEEVARQLKDAGKGAEWNSIVQALLEKATAP